MQGRNWPVPFDGYTGNAQLCAQAVDAITLDADFDLLQRHALAPREPEQSQRLAGTQCGIVDIVRRGP